MPPPICRHFEPRRFDRSNIRTIPESFGKNIQEFDVFPKNPTIPCCCLYNSAHACSNKIMLSQKLALINFSGQTCTDCFRSVTLLFVDFGWDDFKNSFYTFLWANAMSELLTENK